MVSTAGEPVNSVAALLSRAKARRLGPLTREGMPLVGVTMLAVVAEESSRSDKAGEFHAMTAGLAVEPISTPLR